jgi:hypothetical protein
MMGLLNRSFSPPAERLWTVPDGSGGPMLVNVGWIASYGPADGSLKPSTRICDWQ